MNSWVKYIQDAIDALSHMAKESVDPSVISKLLSSFSAGENEESLGKQRKEDISGRLVSYLPHLCVKRLVQRDLMRGTPPSSDSQIWYGGTNRPSFPTLPFPDKTASLTFCEAAKCRQQQLTAMLPSQSDADVVTLPGLSLSSVAPRACRVSTACFLDAAVAVMDISGFTRLNEILASQGLKAETTFRQKQMTKSL